jgi:hypothetical protein
MAFYYQCLGFGNDNDCEHNTHQSLCTKQIEIYSQSPLEILFYQS